MPTAAKLIPRLIRSSVLAVEQSEGAGARVRRSIGTPQLRNLSPFLMLDRMYYLPFLLWVDLPRARKACEPRYRDLAAREVPVVEGDGGRVRVRVISGRSGGVEGVRDVAYTPVWLLDVEVWPGGALVQPLPEGWNAFGDGEGEGEGEARTVPRYHTVVFERAGEAVYASVDAAAERSARFVLVAGAPLDQKVVQYGPFVLTSQEEVYQAVVDYQTHANGFERAAGVGERDWEAHGARGGVGGGWWLGRWKVFSSRGERAFGHGQTAPPSP
ncbi:RmlC-like cupin [Trichocladium antarcticum]|uniref:RmlC-like cupin n=1 Tax=Trichocladium antarcticum TaxID=1450529 RepID=A0AAN6ZCV7_9PEZI|nr:RmlC-like cupin [Trichocladium antarcticum]